jgi:Na+/H+-dicarboxylate symporter
MLAGGLAALAISVGTVGLPGQVSFFASIAPICIVMGVPIEVLPLLLAVEVVPDIFRTIGNVTADMAAARIVEGSHAAVDPDPDPTSSTGARAGDDRPVSA